MLAAMFLVAATQVTTPQLANIPSSHTTAVVRELTRHERHELHMAHLRYLDWLAVSEEAQDDLGEDSPHVTVTSSRFAPGVYSCHELQQIWIAAGGSPRAAFIASEIAEAESGGRSWVISPTDDYGFWQINASHGRLATLDPLGNARAAVLISHNGSDWFPWTTYVTGAYAGQCLGSGRLAGPVTVGTELLVPYPLALTVGCPLDYVALASTYCAGTRLFRDWRFAWHLTASRFRACRHELTTCHFT